MAKTAKQSARQAAREARLKKQRQKRIFTGAGIGLGILLVALLIFFVVNRSSGVAAGLMGTEVPVSTAAHIPENTKPGPYPSDPPAGGQHYAVNYPAKFYNENDPETQKPYPEGYLLHSMEHGYVIFWYNCQAKGVDCAALKQTIQKVMNDNGGTKLIAFPWPKMDVPLAMTSWGRLLKFTTPDAKVMDQFVKSNRYQAPEPDAP